MSLGDAFEAVLSAHLPLIDRIIAAHERQPAIRQDLRQEAALALWRALPMCRDRDRLKAFVARVVQNVCIDHVRSAARRKIEPGLAAALREAAEPAPADPRLERLLDAVRALPDGHRQIITLFLEDFSHRDMAEALDVSEGAVAVRLTRAKTALRKAMGQDE